MHLYKRTHTHSGPHSRWIRWELVAEANDYHKSRGMAKCSQSFKFALSWFVAWYHKTSRFLSHLNGEWSVTSIFKCVSSWQWTWLIQAFRMLHPAHKFNTFCHNKQINVLFIIHIEGEKIHLFKIYRLQSIGIRRRWNSLWQHQSDKRVTECVITQIHCWNSRSVHQKPLVRVVIMKVNCMKSQFRVEIVRRWWKMTSTIWDCFLLQSLLTPYCTWILCLLFFLFPSSLLLNHKSAHTHACTHSPDSLMFIIQILNWPSLKNPLYATGFIENPRNSFRFWK